MLLKELMSRFPNFPEKEIAAATEAIIKSYENGGSVFTCGNGGSCADSDHISGELLKGFLKKRPLSGEKKEALRKAGMEEEYIAKLQQGLSCVPLTALSALMTATANDTSPDLAYAQSLTGLGKKGDVFIGITTSGNAANVNAAAKVAKALGMTVIGMTGAKGGKLKETADICICAPETETYKVQECHLPIYHVICADVEAHFFDN